MTILQTPGLLPQIPHSSSPDLSSHPLSTQSLHLSKMSGTDDKPVGVETVNSPTASNDLVKAVDKLLNEIGPKFTKVSAELFAKSE